MTINRNASMYLAFANLQMAAEAFLANAVGDGKGAVLRQQLMNGNKYNSRFTVQGADEFAANFKVLRHTDNPGRTDGDLSGTFGEGTGFSGTLFDSCSGNQHA